MEVIEWKLKHQRDMYTFVDLEALRATRVKLMRILSRRLQNSADVIKRFKETSDADFAKMDQPADKAHVRKIQTQINKKQEAYVYSMGQKLDKLTTEIAVLRNDNNTFQQGLRQWADSVNGQLRFTYAICKKADLFMKEKQSSDPFSVAPRLNAPTSRRDIELGSSSDPFSITPREQNGDA